MATCMFYEDDNTAVKSYDISNYAVIEKNIDAEKGIGLFATTPIKSGDVIFEENPIVSSQFLYNKDLKYSACDYCMKPLENACDNMRRLIQDQTLDLPHTDCYKETVTSVTCSQCAFAKYCSEECKNVAFDTYHRILCRKSDTIDPEDPLNKMELIWRGCHYPPETLSITIVPRLLAYIVQSSNSYTENERLAQFANSDFVCAAKTSTNLLLSEAFAPVREDLRKCVQEIFLEHQEVERWLSPEGFNSLLAIVACNAQGVGTSPFSEYVLKVEAKDMDETERAAVDVFLNEIYTKADEVVGDFLNSEGSALYKVQSRINHSCNPNAFIQFSHNNHTLSVEALHDIWEGEEITISYLDECDRIKSRNYRQKELKENYLFDCNCEVCEKQINQVSSSEEESEEEEEEEEGEEEGEEEVRRGETLGYCDEGCKNRYR